jgi:hypothetical protein
MATKEQEEWLYTAIGMVLGVSGAAVKQSVQAATASAPAGLKEAKDGEHKCQPSGGTPTAQATVAPGKPAQASTKTGGTKGKLRKIHGHFVYQIGGYWLSIPPNPAGTFPLLMLFGGKDHASEDLIGEPPPSYFEKAILVFSVSLGSFSEAKSKWEPLLAQNQTAAGCISLCGWSLGGQGAFNNYGKATKAVGFMDSTVYYGNLAKLDSKAIYSYNPRPGAWPWQDKAHPWKDQKAKKPYTMADARQEAWETVARKGGVADPPTGIEHDAYPADFLTRFESKLI